MEGIDTILQRHNTSQFIALAGKHLITEQPDDSHTNMTYLPDHILDRYAVFSNRGISRSIGPGWAIPDDMVDEPYYYLSFWSEDPFENFNALPNLEAGEWIRRQMALIW